ncbi:MAG: DapH/DapD/GlmU-related protein [Ruthenibacterium sp.]
MSLESQMKSGLLFCENGHASAEDRAYEDVLRAQSVRGKNLAFTYNHVLPSDTAQRRNLLEQLLGAIGTDALMEEPIHFSYGCNTFIGHHFYSNFNLVVVDDSRVQIGNYVMFGPNVTLSATGHPVVGEYRRDGTQFTLPITIGDDVWRGANVVVLPGVTIGSDVVIGAGSIVTQDIPSHVVALGTPCRVLRPITEHDKAYYAKNRAVNFGWRD